MTKCSGSRLLLLFEGTDFILVLLNEDNNVRLVMHFSLYVLFSDVVSIETFMPRQLADSEKIAWKKYDNSAGG